MEKDDTETQSYREEQGKEPVKENDQRERPFTVGTAARGVVGTEGDGQREEEDTSVEADRRASEERDRPAAS